MLLAVCVKNCYCYEYNKTKPISLNNIFSQHHHIKLEEEYQNIISSKNLPELEQKHFLKKKKIEQLQSYHMVFSLYDFFLLCTQHSNTVCWFSLCWIFLVGWIFSKKLWNSIFFCFFYTSFEFYLQLVLLIFNKLKMVLIVS